LVNIGFLQASEGSGWRNLKRKHESYQHWPAMPIANWALCQSRALLGRLIGHASWAQRLIFSPPRTLCPAQSGQGSGEGKK
jgi:hypothetical protein